MCIYLHIHTQFFFLHVYRIYPVTTHSPLQMAMCVSILPLVAYFKDDLKAVTLLEQPQSLFTEPQRFHIHQDTRLTYTNTHTHTHRHTSTGRTRVMAEKARVCVWLCVDKKRAKVLAACPDGCLVPGPLVMNPSGRSAEQLLT